MRLHRIKGGYDIPVQGKSEFRMEDLPRPVLVAITPVDYPGLDPVATVKERDHVRIGSTLLLDRTNPYLRICSPANGRVISMEYGARQTLQKITISLDGMEAESHQAYNTDDIASIPRNALIAHLLAGGVWHLLRERPFGKIADPRIVPSSIFVNCMDSSPLAPVAEFSLQGNDEAFRAGLEAIRVLGENRVHLVVNGRKRNSWFLGNEGVEKHGFTGPHPAGLVGSHISRIDPIAGRKRVWWATARDVVFLGQFLLTGIQPTDRVVAIAGAGARKRMYYRTQIGILLDELLKENPTTDNELILSGNVLTGSERKRSDALGFYDDLVTILPAPKRRRGKARPLVMTGQYRRVMGLDVYPDFLVKAILTEDCKLMEELGILESDPEDYALCSYICPSGFEFTEVIRRGLALFEANRPGDGDETIIHDEIKTERRIHNEATREDETPGEFGSGPPRGEDRSDTNEREQAS